MRANGHRRDIVVVGGSAGALEPLKRIVADLPADLEVAMLVVLHLSPTSTSALSTILNTVGGMRSVTPRDGDPVLPGYIYVAEPDKHLDVSTGFIRKTHEPKVNGARPAVDILFQSAADVYGPRTIGVILSGGLDDGSAGLAAICAAGGVGIVQDPDEATVGAMPRNAIERAIPDHVVKTEEIGPLLTHIVGESIDDGHNSRGHKGGETMAERVGARDIDGEVTGLTCPDCHGSIWLRSRPGEVTFTCRVGHSYSPESFFEVQAGNVENALWAAVRSLEEQAALAGVMAGRAQKMNDMQGRDRYGARKDLAVRNAETLRKLLLQRD